MKLAKKFLLLVMLFMFACSTTVFAYYYDYDKEKGIVRLGGYAAAPKNRNPKGSFTKLYAFEAARLDALRNIAEEVVGVSFIKPTSESLDIIIAESRVTSEIAKNARLIGEPVFNYNKKNNKLTCEIIMEINIKNLKNK